MLGVFNYPQPNFQGMLILDYLLGKYSNVKRMYVPSPQIQNKLILLTFLIGHLKHWLKLTVNST